MAVLKNTTGQGLYVYAHDTAADAAKTGDAANITAKLSLDGGAYADTNDVNPTEIGRGVYWFALTQAETNAGALALMPVSATADVVLDALLVLTQEAAITYQSGDAYARLGAPAGASVSADIAAIEAQTDDIGTAGAGLTALGDTRLANLDAAVSTRSTYAGGAVASVTDKTGFKLASDGLDSIATTAPTGVASNFREMMVALFRRFFKKVTMTATQIKTYDDAGTGTLTTQTVADDGTTQTQGAAT